MAARTRTHAKTSSVFPEPNHNHKACSSQALAAAERLCEANDARLTDIRKRVLTAIWSSHKPVGAYDLLKVLAADTDVSAPTTVYRAIDFLMEQGLVHRLASLNAFVGCAHPGDEHTAQFMICDECGTAAEFDERPADKLLVKAAADNGFTVKKRVVELIGTCAHCAHS